MLRKILLVVSMIGLASSTLFGATELQSIKLKIDLVMDKNERAVDTLVLPGREWVAKRVGVYSVRAKAQTTAKDDVKVELEMTSPSSEKPRKANIITKWEGPTTLESKDDSGQLGYHVVVTAFKNQLNDSEK